MPTSAVLASAVLAAGSNSNPVAGFLPIILIVGVFYLFIIRPQRRRMASMRETVAAVEPGRQVITTAGLMATVTAVDGDEVELEIAPGVRTRWAKQAIGRVIPLPSEEESDDAGELGHTDPDGTAG
ncbi:MAG: preprotein translocase subunit YajC [Frankiaceae bacterium]|nr:preprotein translocase subunit YajC [Frankiaceae bacterium]MDX6275535.1 preprotein translocase subunit YajC [Frankiales bacterium]